METARIVEIFSSLQGEGLYAGQRQIFLRFAGCNLACDYCDEPFAQDPSSGRHWSINEVKREIARLASVSTPPKAVSLTGGEPLLHVNCLLEILPWIKQIGLAAHLETNATLPAAFKRISGLVDAVAADIKLPSSTGKQTWRLHKRFLEFCRDAAPPPKTFVKIVLTSSSTWEEWERAVEMLEAVSGDIPLFIQPATGGLSLREPGVEIRAADNEFVLRALDRARRTLSDVRVLGQQHPVWGVK